jgi:hypothetical protein
MNKARKRGAPLSLEIPLPQRALSLEIPLTKAWRYSWLRHGSFELAQLALLVRFRYLSEPCQETCQEL